jgi:hypothetical protein
MIGRIIGHFYQKVGNVTIEYSNLAGTPFATTDLRDGSYYWALKEPPPWKGAVVGSLIERAGSPYANIN